jgi:hypothetical protein
VRGWDHCSFGNHCSWELPQGQGHTWLCMEQPAGESSPERGRD